MSCVDQVLDAQKGKGVVATILRIRAAFSIRVLTLALALLLLPALLIQLYTGFFHAGFFLTHDEAEHLHVVFALARGERPYIDFIENHPVLFHLVLLWMAKFLGLANVLSIYWLGKALAFIHFLGCLALLALVLRHFSSHLELKNNIAVLLVIALSVSGIWAESTEWNWGHYSLWHLRPDWLCHFYAMSCLCLHFVFHWRLFRGQANASLWLVVLAGFSGGLATAILAKSVYFFLPYAMLVMSIILTEHETAYECWRNYRKQIVVANMLFVFVGLASFSLLVLVELSASHVSFTEYYKANFLLNATKHIPVNAEDFNPINVLRSLLGFGLIPTIALGMWIMHRLAMPQRQNAQLQYYIWYFLFLIVIVNMTLSAFTNGLTWPHYLIPSLLALLVILGLAVDTIFKRFSWVDDILRDEGSLLLLKKHLRWAVSTLIAMVLGLFVFTKWQAAFDSLENLSFSDQLYLTRIGDDERDFLSERLLPNDLTYLIFQPQHKPANARAWGYYFMLGPDKKLWRDTHTLGLSPDPDSHWRKLYSIKPPDVIALSSKDDFVSRKLMLRGAQQVNIGWLWTNMQKDYTCQSRKGLRIHVRNDLLPRFQSENWQACASSLENNFEEKGSLL